MAASVRQDGAAARGRRVLTGALTWAAGMALALLASAPAQAQKSADLLRVAIIDPISTTLYYDDQKPELPLFSSSIYDTLMCYDRKAGVFLPALAKSWRQVDPVTIEFTLRDDVQFHNGDRLTADDVVYTLNWARDPASKLRFAPNEYQLGWIEKAEKTGDFTLLVKSVRPMPLAMIRLAVTAPIINAKIHRGLENKSDYGRRTPIGTGPYKVESFDQSAGVKLVRNEAYKHGSACKPAAQIGRVHLMPIPDPQTQIAQLLAGGVDVLRVQTKDAEDAFLANPDLTLSAVRNTSVLHLMLDAADRAKKGHFADQRVRLAVALALDREKIARAVMPGGKDLYAVDALCVVDEIACAVTRATPGYDPARAKALLAEAGFPNGFEMTISALPSGYTLIDAVAGELRKIGIRASVEKLTFAAFRRKQADNLIEALVADIPSQSALDASSTPNYYFSEGVRNYSADPRLTELNMLALREMDPEKRKALYAALNDRNNDVLHVIPLVANPAVYAHPKTLNINVDMVHPEGFALYDMSWK